METLSGLRRSSVLKRLVMCVLVIGALSAMSAPRLRHPVVVSRAAPTETILHAFSGSDGASPESAVIEDTNGVLYGTTAMGGSHFRGAAYALTPKGTNYTESVLYSFGRTGADAMDPSGPLSFGSSGTLYGTTSLGGHTPCACGTAFALTPSGSTYTETILHAFAGARDGTNPVGGLLVAADGSLYGATAYGGSTTCRGQNSGQYGCGTVFKLTSRGNRYVETVLYRFSGGADGMFPFAGLIQDASGNFYGTTVLGGNGGCGGLGCGVVWELKAMGSRYVEQVLYRFKGTRGGFSDGQTPVAPLLMDANGALYGTTEFGGGSRRSDGIVFKLTPKGNRYAETVLHKFLGSPDGAEPVAGLIEDQTGTLYGTTLTGGASGSGAVFALTPQGSTYSESVVYSFQGPPSDGQFPAAALLPGGTGTFFGTTFGGPASSQGGTVFELKL